MKTNKHLIEKVTFDIGVASQQGAFEIQNRISDAFKHAMLPKLEAIFDRLIPSDQVVTIDRLQLDLGRIPINDLEEQFTTELEKEIESTVLAILVEHKESGNIFRKGQSFLVRLPGKGKIEFEATVSIKSESISRFQRLQQILESGFVSNSYSSSEKITLSELFAEIYSTQPEILYSYLKSKWQHRDVLTRLIYNLTATQLAQLAGLINPILSRELPELITEISDFCAITNIGKEELNSASHVVTVNISQAIWYSFLAKCFAQYGSKQLNSHEWKEELPSIILKVIMPGKAAYDKLVAYDNRKEITKSTRDQTDVQFTGTFKLLVKELRKQIQHDSAIAPGKRVGKTKANQESVPNNLTHIVSQQLAQFKNTRSELISIPSAGNNTITTSEEHTIITDSTSTEIDTIPDNGIYIRNAGLIILAPYLLPFFTNRGLVRNKEFVNKESSWKAVHLLQHATGLIPSEENEGWSEHDLIFNKILCGVEISEPVPELLAISEEDKQEVDLLLKAVLQNWPLLSRTSVPTLQVTFLQKNGRLQKNGSDWEMLVERDSAVEILIDKLPWGISMIKLPWNSYTIHTQW